MNRDYMKVFSSVCFFVAAVCMFSLMLNDGVEIPIQLPPYKFLPDFPLLIWIALALITLGLVIHFGTRSGTGESHNLAIAILAVVLFYGVLPISESVLRWRDSYMHASIAEYVIQNARLYPSEIGYHSWPGFYLWFAQLQIITGIDVQVLAKIAHLVPNILLVVALFAIYSRAGFSNAKAILLGVITFIVANDRIYYHVSPQNFSFALLVTFFYTALLGQRRRFFWLVSLVLFIGVIVSHPFNPLFIILPVVVLAIALRIFSVPKQSFSRYFNLLVVGICIWVGWMLFNIDAMWWYYGVTSIIGIERGLAGESSLVHAPVYWRWATPPFEVALLRAAILFVVLLFAFVGVLGIIRKLGLISFRGRLRIKRSLNERALPFLTFASLLVGIIITGVLSFLIYSQMLGSGDRFLQFIWIPLAFFSTSLIARQRRRKIKISLAIVIALLLVPAFINTHWHEFWLSTQTWEEDYLEFADSNCDFSREFLINTDAWFMLKGIRGPLSTLRGMTEGERYYSLPALDVFNGTLAPESLNWTYLIHSIKLEVNLNLDFKIQPEGLQRMDVLLAKSPLINRVYDSEYAQFYYRTLNSTEN